MSQQNIEQAGTPSVTGHPHAQGTKRPVNYDQRPMLVFWETTRACQLACKHCRASATPGALPGELTHDEGIAFIDSIAGFGRPHPILVLTGGDCLLRPDIFELVDHATSLGIPTALSPSVTPMLTPEAIQRIVDSGVKAVSISLDGATAATHEGVRGIPGHFPATVAAIRALKRRRPDRPDQHDGDVEEPARDAGRRRAARCHGRRHLGGLLPGARRPRCRRGRAHAGRARGRLPPALRRVAVRLHRAYGRGTVLPPRRRQPSRRRCHPGHRPLPRALRADARAHGPRHPPPERPHRRDPRRQGHRVRRPRRRRLPRRLPPAQARQRARDRRWPTSTATTRTSRSIRAAEFSGQCGVCTFADMCGGSRARAWAATGDVLSEDPACQLVAEVTSQVPVLGGAR